MSRRNRPWQREYRTGGNGLLLLMPENADNSETNQDGTESGGLPNMASL